MKYLFVIVLLVFFTLGSCVNRKNIVYFQGKDSISSGATNIIKLKKEDFLAITIFGIDESSMKLFNVPQSTSTINRGYNNGIPATFGYLIDLNGEIQFPIIGNVKLEGLNKSEAIELLKTKLKDYLQNPVINLQIQNFKVTVLGEVKNPGSFNIPNEKISLIEAIGLAGDLTINAVRKNIKVIREENNIKKEYIVDFTSKDFINSPVFYLQQNDIVYIEPNQAKINSSIISSASGVIISVASLIITTINVLSK
jgi:polysaccharide export outer membrane protein